jgi:hypothetical protein
VRRAGVDDDEAMFLREVLVRAALVVCLGGAAAVVNCNDDAGRSSKLLGHVDEETGLGRGVAERSDLLEASGGNGALSESGRGRDREEAGEKAEKTHVVSRLDVGRICLQTRPRVAGTTT